jgi:5-methylcytosine-specific restriction endonuclease McrA
VSAQVSRALRRLVHDRAGGCCEYCLISEQDSPFDHQVDHVIPRKHGGRTGADNLALACIEDNRRKGSDLSAIDPDSGAVVSLFDPRRQTWTEHFALRGVWIEGRTATGRATVALLQLNAPLRLLARETLAAVGRYPPLPDRT